jgi:uncharacterized DUF497 family protein
MRGFEWDPDKAAENLKKHEVDFADAAVSLSDPLALTIEDPDSEGEERFISLTMGPTGTVLLTVYSYVEDNVRIISSRRASPGERINYEAGYA